MSSSIESSSLIIGIIVISIVAGLGLLGILYLLVRRKNHQPNTRVLSTEDIPVTSSLDTHDVFLTILEYPPTKPPTCIPNNRLLDISTFEEKTIDPISVSLARQSIEERSGYYKSPNRTPVPYYQSSLHSGNSNLIIMDEETMQRWSTSSYHVW